MQYYAKRSGKDFKGTDTTKSAIESSKKSKGGRQRFLVLSEKDVKILKRDAKVGEPHIREAWLLSAYVITWAGQKGDNGRGAKMMIYNETTDTLSSRKSYKKLRIKTFLRTEHLGTFVLGFVSTGQNLAQGCCHE